MDNYQFNIQKQLEIKDRDKDRIEVFPDEKVIKYLLLKAVGCDKKTIMKEVEFGSLYEENRFRKYILKKMKCKNINQAVLKAIKKNWIPQI